ncbi:serine/threonine-protein kinase ATG1 [Pseudozyma hubeiensis SY62]|uniref:Serine/threonine-protein kinase ATG1 n=1 Tax=Pseudozyma hubeiensis (strain SY62) TaxID=1305764 RepID=R9P8Y9_PSEHS|nr:serine/threonine-protein kinase ATG1 [Pseudozyma hubeiensis SY62]GAC97814.1 serine/threonine-protein kinase ATG1 [Pseudozyma hubeiensis SY62]
MMMPDFVRRGRSTTSNPDNIGKSHGSTRRKSNPTCSRKPSRTSSQLDDWSDGFTGFVDLDRRMRELAMSEQGFPAFGVGDHSDVYEPFPRSPSSWSDRVTDRRRSSSDSTPSSISQLYMATDPTNPSLTPSFSSTTATSRFSQDSFGHFPSSWSKRASVTASNVDSLESVHSPLRLAPLPACPSAFGNFRLTDAAAASKSKRFGSNLSPSSWSSQDDCEPRTPLAAGPGSSKHEQYEPLTPGIAAAATWVDPSAFSYFPAGLGSSDSSKLKTRSLRKKATRAPLPRLISGEVVSSAIDLTESPVSTHSWHQLKHSASAPANDRSDRKDASSSSTHAFKRSAQSLALNLRRKINRAKRNVHRSGQDVAPRATWS